MEKNSHNCYRLSNVYICPISTSATDNDNWYLPRNTYKPATHLAFTCSKSITEAPEPFAKIYSKIAMKITKRVDYLLV